MINGNTAGGNYPQTISTNDNILPSMNKSRLELYNI